MYQLGKRERDKRRRKRWLLFAALFLVCVIAGAIFIKNALRPHTKLTQSKAVITKIDSTPGNVKHYEEHNFTVDVPSEWDFEGQQTSPYTVYRWKTPAKVTAARELAIYEDTIPTNFAINRALAVEHESGHLTLLGTASDNCSEFTKSPPTVTTFGIRAKWQGFEFMCDVANKTRNVIGSVSADGTNTVKLNGAVSGAHQYFFTYDEHTINADYNIFYRILQSFHMQ